MRHLLACLALLLAASLVPACGDDDTGGTKGATRPAPAPDAGGRVAVEAGLDAALQQRVADALAKGRAFLLTQQEDSGGFTDHAVEQMQANVSFTAMAVAALVAATPPTGVEHDPAIRKGLEFLVGFQQENGSIVDDPKWTNYCTSAAVSALALAKAGDFRKAQSRAAAYLEGSQIAGDENDGSFGGFPYKVHLGQSADASNALMAGTALEANGLPDDSPVRARLAKFASGLQNRSESNTRTLVIKTDSGEERTVVAGNDGGAVYRVGESKAGMVKRSDGTWELKSYGSMTYAVLKLMLFAGVKVEDPRVAAIVGWMANHWTVERNPGFENAEDPDAAGQQGYFYYLYTVTRALAAYEKASGKPLVVRDSDGRKHNWRAEIADALLTRQAEDGSWRNAVDRWMEGMQTLATGFALQTLGYLTGRLE